MRLCREEEIEEGDARGFRFGEGAAETRIFVLRWEGAIKAYRNVCPHVGTPLDWVPDKFFHPDDRHLICATHGALFLPENGLCVAGPCEGESLQAASVEVDEGWIVYRPTSPPP